MARPHLAIGPPTASSMDAAPERSFDPCQDRQSDVRQARWPLASTASVQRRGGRAKPARPAQRQDQDVRYVTIKRADLRNQRARATAEPRSHLARCQ